MARFKVYRVSSGRLVLDLQTDLFDTRFPRRRTSNPDFRRRRVLGRLEPVFEIEGDAYALHTAEMAAIPSALLNGPPIADLSESDYEIRGALDMVFSGF